MSGYHDGTFLELDRRWTRRKGKRRSRGAALVENQFGLAVSAVEASATRAVIASAAVRSAGGSGVAVIAAGAMRCRITAAAAIGAVGV